MIYFTSDTHFGHFNSIRFDKRPFATVEEMDLAIIARWNERVGPNDEVYHLGDFAFRNAMAATHYLDRLNGRKHLIWGNHDSNQVKKMPGWASSQPVLELKVGDDLVCLSHYAHRTWNKSHYGSFHLFGHTHGSMPAYGRSLDVGCMCWDYRPVTLAEIKERLAELGLIDKFGFQSKEETDV